ncbi:hypothetical protein HK100_010435, partial [Physocladia obscura]
WRRSSEIVESVFPRFSDKIKWLVHIAPFLLFLQAVPPIIVQVHQPSPKDDSSYYRNIEMASSVLPGLSGLFAVLFDVFFLIAFTSYIKKNTRLDPQHEIDERFLIISKFGQASCCISLAAVMTYGLSFFIN